MSKLFPNYIIDLKKGTVFSLLYKREIGNKTNKDGYNNSTFKDVFKNKYRFRHEVILAEKLQLPKHLWPIDDKGRRFEVDHIIPIKNGGTDEADNLRLVSRKENSNNPLSIINTSNSQKGENNNNYGKQFSEEHRRKMSESMKGKLRTEESKKRISESHKKIIIQKKPNGEIIEWNSGSDCEIATNGFYQQGNISLACKGTYSRKKDFHLYKGSEWYFKT